MSEQVYARDENRAPRFYPTERRQVEEKEPPGKGIPVPDLGVLAEAERGKLADPFRAWVLKRRQELEVEAENTRQFLREVEPFARMAERKVETIPTHGPDRDYQEWGLQVPVVLWEYAVAALDLSGLEAALAPFQAYAWHAASPASDVTLNNRDEATAATVRVLWDAYLAAQGVEE